MTATIAPNRSLRYYLFDLARTGRTIVALVDSYRATATTIDPEYKEILERAIDEQQDHFDALMRIPEIAAMSTDEIDALTGTFA